jgi:NADPH:quinone reductase-like Zn-dependent oxidoreductase
MRIDMQSIVVFGSKGAPAPGGRQVVTIDGVTLPCGVAPLAATPFDPAGADRRRVLMRVRAVSCNYRDKAFLTSMGGVEPPRFSAFGSEFAGEVVEVGADVATLSPGDRVLPDFHYEGSPLHSGDIPAGVPTNRASRAMHVLHERQLQRIPHGMPDVEAAAFALNAQTAYAMVRRAGLRPGAAVLVTSASSNLSLALFAALRGRGARVFATTSSPATAARLGPHGVEGAAVVARNREGFVGDEGLTEFAAGAGGFDAVLDPFFDLHLERAVALMNPFGTYVTCGFAGQTAHAAQAAGVRGGVSMHNVLGQAVLKNLTLVGNCIGFSEDLERALGDYQAGHVPPLVIDSVFEGDATASFLDRTFNAPDRFGKVVYRYA